MKSKAQWVWEVHKSVWLVQLFAMIANKSVLPLYYRPVQHPDCGVLGGSTWKDSRLDRDTAAIFAHLAPCLGQAMREVSQGALLIVSGSTYKRADGCRQGRATEMSGYPIGVSYVTDNRFIYRLLF